MLYEDGVGVARNTSVTITPGAIGSGTTTADHLGRSVHSGDKLFKGRMRDFRVHDRALAAAEVEQLALPVATRGVADDGAALGLGDTSAVTADLDLPRTGTAGGSAITWASDTPSVVTDSGKVTRPAAGAPDGRATLTATLTKGTVTATKSFDVTVLAAFADATAARRAADALTVHGLDDVRGNLTLPSAGARGTAVTRASARPDAVAADGVVHRPAHGAGATTVELTATVTKGDATATRVFTAKVPELPAPAALKGCLFSCFTGEGTADGEQLHFALSKGDDPLKWRELNDGRPVLTSSLGEKGLRDPFVIRSPEGDKSYQTATDLRIYGNGDWDAAQRTGGRSFDGTGGSVARDSGGHGHHGTYVRTPGFGTGVHGGSFSMSGDSAASPYVQIPNGLLENAGSVTVPTGHVTLAFGPARLKFRSTAADRLVVTGSEGVLQGSGTVDGVNGYAFRVTATDAPDAFRIRIWKKSTGGVVYDNGIGAKVAGVVSVGR